jgi:hypothetical protein
VKQPRLQATVKMTNSVLMFVPYSVRMRSVGYELDKKQWVPAAVKKVRDEKRAKISAVVAWRKETLRILGTIPRAEVNWYNIVRVEEEAYEARFLAMSEEEWHHWQSDDVLSWQNQTQRVHGLAFWDRIESLRNNPAQEAEATTLPKECSPVNALLQERREILEFPQGNGISSLDEQEAVVADIEATIGTMSGRWRLGAAKCREQREEVLKNALKNLDDVCIIQRAWRNAIQRRAVYMLGAMFGIY